METNDQLGKPSKRITAVTVGQPCCLCALVNGSRLILLAYIHATSLYDMGRCTADDRGRTHGGLASVGAGLDGWRLYRTICKVAGKDTRLAHGSPVSPPASGVALWTGGAASRFPHPTTAPRRSPDRRPSGKWIIRQQTDDGWSSGPSPGSPAHAALLKTTSGCPKPAWR